jgi:hypothetical protein
MAEQEPSFPAGAWEKISPLSRVAINLDAAQSVFTWSESG